MCFEAALLQVALEMPRHVSYSRGGKKKHGQTKMLLEKFEELRCSWTLLKPHIVETPLMRVLE
jgi:hypothetical protein